MRMQEPGAARSQRLPQVVAATDVLMLPPQLAEGPDGAQRGHVWVRRVEHVPQDAVVALRVRRRFRCFDLLERTGHPAGWHIVFQSNIQL